MQIFRHNIKQKFFTQMQANVLVNLNIALQEKLECFAGSVLSRTETVKTIWRHFQYSLAV